MAGEEERIAPQGSWQLLATGRAVEDMRKNGNQALPLRDSAAPAMQDKTPQDDLNENNDFSAEADSAPPSLVAEFCDFLVNNKKWWLIPIILVLLLVGGLAVIGSSAAAPFIYTLF